MIDFDDLREESKVTLMTSFVSKSNVIVGVSARDPGGYVWSVHHSEVKMKKNQKNPR